MNSTYLKIIKEDKLLNMDQRYYVSGRFNEKGGEGHFRKKNTFYKKHRFSSVICRTYTISVREIIITKQNYDFNIILIL